MAPEESEADRARVDRGVDPVLAAKEDSAARVPAGQVVQAVPEAQVVAGVADPVETRVRTATSTRNFF